MDAFISAIKLGQKRLKPVPKIIATSSRSCSVPSVTKTDIDNIIKKLSEANVVSSKVKKEKIITASHASSQPQVDFKSTRNEFRKNPLNIQMLSNSLYEQIYGQEKNDEISRELIEKAQNELQKHGLWTEQINPLPDVSIDIPKLQGRNVEEHFYAIGEEQCGPYRNLILGFIRSGIPESPKNWLCKKGWTKYVVGKEPESILYPDDDALVFDVEVCMNLGDAPTLAVAVSANAWYGWVCSALPENTNPVASNYYTTDMLVPFEGKAISKTKPRIIAGHNVSYDRARIKEQYYLKPSALRFIDTMSLHISIAGATRSQKTTLKTKTGNDESEDWMNYSCLSSLHDVYSLYCQGELKKEEREVFVKGTIQDVRDDFQNLMSYCADDVLATYRVLKEVFPTFLSRFPHPVTLSGMLEMGTAFLPVNSNWNRFMTESEQTYDDFKTESHFLLGRKADNACCLMHEEKYKTDLWMWSEDWSIQELKLTKKKLKKITEEAEETCKEEEEEDEDGLNKKFEYLFRLGEILPQRKPHLPGYPAWYRKLCDKPKSFDWRPGPLLISSSMLITPKLLNLKWENYPLHHVHKYGWGVLIPDFTAEGNNTVIPFEKLKELALQNGISEFDREGIHDIKKSLNCNGVWTDHMVDDCCYFLKLPHKDGPDKNVGNPLAKDFMKTLTTNTLSGSDAVAEKVLEIATVTSYWRNNRERISKQTVVWLNKKEVALVTGSDEYTPIGVILPKVVVCGTLTRRAMEPTWMTASKTVEKRIGSELKAMIQAPPNYHIVGADVDSQELWIASVIGDSHYGKLHGATPFGWMTLRGTKNNETDMHSVTAKTTGISRDAAKVINYARIYGAGVRFAERLLKQYNPSMTNVEAKSKAKKMYALTKGKKRYKMKESARKEFSDVLDEKQQAYDLYSAIKIAKYHGKKLDDMFETTEWFGGTESAMFNRLEEIANSPKAVTPFLECRLSRALESRFEGDDMYSNTRVNWVVQSGAVDFLHLMLVCMKWLTNGQAHYCLSFHDEVRYLIPSDKRYQAALALQITNLLTRAFCAYRLGLKDLPQSVAFFSSVEIDKVLRKEAQDDCVTPSNPHGLELGYGIPPGESLDIYQIVDKTGGSLSVFDSKTTR